MSRVNVNSKVFKTEAYLKDQYKFSLVKQNLASAEVLLYSDDENYLLCRGNEKYPTWVWTKDHLSKDKYLEVMESMKYYLTNREKDKFTCKKEFYDFLVQENYTYLNLEDYFEMGFLRCYQVKEPKTCDGYLDHALESDLDLLAQYWYQSNQEMGVETKTYEEAYEEMKDLYLDDTFYVWRNSKHEVVSMACYRVTEDVAKVGHVFTSKEERGKGYAANLVYALTKLLLEYNYVPLLYTDLHYPASNKAYQNVGYEDEGMLVNFSCSKVKKR